MNSVVMESSAEEKKMHYPVMTERQLAFRWKISLKTLRRWRLDGEGPVWHKLFQHVRYHEADVLEFERQSAQHWTAILGDGERFPRAVTHSPKAEGDPQPSDAAEPELQYISAKEIVEATSLPAHLFNDRIERERKRIPHLLLVRNLRFSMDVILQWELANSVRGGVPEAVVQIVEPEPEPDASGRVPRWHELVREQDGERCDSVR
ncbi:helix-turn-helix domain-containing protein [Thermomonas sp. RSS23]|uniref:Helix-turn-helix domain-containing protein n=1 Tax=Thermomonas beijingensis TaxID=2872701 RepID=A0ABS7TFK8_9GAMM|nr:helix-turn-helix domain-containing protein [Thermomonas beijingensis]MBZ4186632.1 helix-turn-helix domain-containing protein [Thermomonas beijingensis]